MRHGKPEIECHGPRPKSEPKPETSAATAPLSAISESQFSAITPFPALLTSSN